jgi:hypothetical protein
MAMGSGTCAACKLRHAAFTPIPQVGVSALCQHGHMRDCDMLRGFSLCTVVHLVAKMMLPHVTTPNTLLSCACCIRPCTLAPCSTLLTLHPMHPVCLCPICCSASWASQRSLSRHQCVCTGATCSWSPLTLRSSSRISSQRYDLF